ncbi:MAG: hypothetical protein WBG95_02030 [Sulfitobacter sp.]
MGAPIWPVLCASVLGFCLPLSVAAQATDGAPLSAIDWLDTPAPLAQLPRANTPLPVTPRPHIDEPAVTDSGTIPQVTSRPLNAGAPRTVGLVPASITGMQPDIWAQSDATEVVKRLRDLPDLDLPAANALLYTVLLAEADAPVGGTAAQDVLTRARVDKLTMLGAVDPALALVEQAGAATSQELFDPWMQLSLLAGTEDMPCGVLARSPHLTRDTGVRIFCAARGGDWDNAALTFGSARALSLLPRPTINILDRFLHPDFFEDAAPLPVPRTMDPLTFRLFETVGEPVATGPLPRAFAVADLRDVAGWKSQLEAAERLTRAGALPDNQLLGLYTDRRPAASGGIWDRVRTIQRFDTALDTGNAEAVGKTLLPVWREMRDAELEVSFSSAFNARIAQVPVTGSAAGIKARMGLLSPDYETVARTLAADVKIGEEDALIRAVAQGETAPRAPQAALARAIHDAFAGAPPQAEWIEMARGGRLGEALVATLGALHDGMRGEQRDLRDALATLRALGLEDTARRAALQILLLEREL